MAGAMGPTTRSITVTRNVDFRGLAGRLLLQAKALIEGGADVLLLETCQDTRNVKAALLGIERLERELGLEIPVMVSGTIEPMGTMLAGQTADAFCASIAHRQPAVDRAELRDRSRVHDGPHPHAARDGEHARLLLSERRAAERGDEVPGDAREPRRQLERFVDHGWLNIVGGCCGTTPAHIRAIAQMVEGKRPRQIRRSARKAYYTGIELVEADESNRPLIVGERTNVIGSRAFKNLIAEEKWEEATEIARRQVRNGAHIIDVCLQTTDRDEMKDIPPFYEKLIRKVKAPIMIDTTDPKAIELALTYCQGKSAHQLDQPRGRRGEVRARLPDRKGLRRRAGGRLHRRGQGAGAGVHARAEARRRRALRRAADREIRHPGRRHHHRPAGVSLRHRRRELHRRRGRDDRSRSG